MNLRQLFSYAKPYSGSLAVLVALNILSSLVLLAVPWLAGQLLGGIVSRVTAQTWPVGLLVLCVAAVAALNFTMAYRSTISTAAFLSDIRGRVFRHLQGLPLAFHDSHRKGDLLALLTYEITRLSQLMTGTLVAIPSRILVTLGALVAMFRIDTHLALLVPVVIPLFYLILKIVGRRLRAFATALQVAEAQVVGVAEEALEILPATKAFTRERAQGDRFGATVGRAAEAYVREGRVNAVLEPLIALVAALAAIAILFVAGRNVDAGTMNPSDLFSFMLYAALLTRPVGALANVYGEVQRARGTLGRLQSVLGEAVEPGLEFTVPFPRVRGEIDFVDVNFAYPGRNATLTGVTLHIRAGETIAFVGPNGAGKTALINLLMRFYEPQSGWISLDGIDLRSMEITNLRQQIGIVPQMAMLFNGTIRDNIAFGALEPVQDEVDEAARLAQAWDFIAALPEGMDTVIGDRGTRLSGGQRQRIALARALVKDPPILIFDEATAMFDEKGEDEFIAVCSRSLEDRTVIIIAHRPATLSLADRVIFVDQGRIRPAGAHSWPRGSIA